MRRKYSKLDSRSEQGFILLITIVLLVVISSIAYMMTSKVSAYKSRQQYIIDYQSAQYACDSGIKYAIASLQEIKPKLISRPNEPDFSDLFAMDELQYQQLIEDYKNQQILQMSGDLSAMGNNSELKSNDANLNSLTQLFDKLTTSTSANSQQDPNNYQIPGPYGAPWPLISEPTQFEIGSAQVTIEIQDENAKYPITWAMIDDPEIQREVQVSFDTFCERTQIDYFDAKDIKMQLQEIAEIKPFKIDVEDVNVVQQSTVVQPVQKSRGRRRTAASKVTKKTIKTANHIADLAQLFHTSLLDRDVLAVPTVQSSYRDESALKYIGIWGSKKVNINTAPRNVLEAAFAFGGDAVNIAEEIIQKRQIKPYLSVEDLRKDLLGYSDSIEKCKQYIDTNSTFFTIHITAFSGVAKASAVIAVVKQDKNIELIAVISESS